MDVVERPVPAKAPISKAVDRRDPPAIRAILLSAWFAWMSWTLTWDVHPVAWMQWTQAAQIEIALWVSLLVVVGVLWALVRMGWRIHQIGPLIIGAHALLGIVTTLVWSDRSLQLALGCMGVLVSLPAAFLFSTQREDSSELRPFLEAACISILLPALLLFAWAPVSMAVVRYQALSVAAGAPFCIQVPADHVGWERQATHWMQLSGLQMQTPWTNGGGSDDYQFAFHAVLVVERDGHDEFYNWSYRSQSFQPVDQDAMSGLHIMRNCVPDVRFFDDLERTGTWELFVRPPMPPLLPRPEDGRAMPKPIDRESEWEVNFWTEMFIRYAGMRALIEACEVAVDPSVLRAIRIYENDARDRLEMSLVEASGTYDRILLDMRVKGGGICNRNNHQFKDMVASFPRGKSSQR